MNIDTTRTYYFTSEELRTIYAFCQLADNIAISENMDYNNMDFSAEDFFVKKHEEYVNIGKISSFFKISDD